MTTSAHGTTPTSPNAPAPARDLPAFLRIGSVAKKEIGDVSETAVQFELQRAGLSLTAPVGDRHRYDLVIMLGDHALRVQTKTGRFQDNGIVEFRARSVTQDPTSQRWMSRGYADDVDLIAAYCPELNRCYLLPAHEVGITVKLRVSTARNNQTTNVRRAVDFEILGQHLPAILTRALLRKCERMGCPAPDGATTRPAPPRPAPARASPPPTAPLPSASTHAPTPDPLTGLSSTLRHPSEHPCAAS